MANEQGISPISASQMQARLEMAQFQRLVGQVQNQARPALDKTPNATAAGKTEASKAADERLVKVSREFESIFLGYMLKTMRDTIPKDGLFDSSREQEIFTSMHDEELAKSLSQAGGIGLGRMMVEQLKKSI